MSENDYREQGNLLKALGHPVRLKIINGLLRGDECNVNKMVEQLGLPQSTVSQHLSVLKNCRIITFRKEGVRACYRVTDERVKAIMAIVEK